MDSNPERVTGGRSISRRTVLKGTGATLSALGLSGTAAAKNDSTHSKSDTNDKTSSEIDLNNPLLSLIEGLLVHTLKTRSQRSTDQPLLARAR